MKNRFLKFSSMRSLVFSFALLLFTVVLRGQSLMPLWETEKVLQVPESVLYSAKSRTLYVSCINGNPAQKDNNGYIAKMDEQGNIVQLKWATGLNAPKGMAIYHDALFVSDIDRIAKIDLATGKILRFYQAPGASFLNDVVTDNEGNVYISDSDKGRIYRLSGDKMKVWLEGPDLKGVNGLNRMNGKMVAGAAGKIWEIDFKTKKITLVVAVGGMIDGLIPVGSRRFIVSDWRGKIQLVGKDFAAVVLQNTTTEKINAADLGYIPQKQIVLIPTFFDNRVVAMRFLTNN